MKLKEIALDRERPALSRSGHAKENTNAQLVRFDLIFRECFIIVMLFHEQMCSFNLKP